jgi:hypothetical protein
MTSIARHAQRSTAPGLCPTASALVALVAIAAMVTSASAATPVVRTEARQSMTEGAAVRAAVAAVAAAARELVGGDRLVQDLPSAWSLELGARDDGIDVRGADESAAPRLTTLAERLLDLPPPRR